MNRCRSWRNSCVLWHGCVCAPPQRKSQYFFAIFCRLLRTATHSTLSQLILSDSLHRVRFHFARENSSQFPVKTLWYKEILSAPNAGPQWSPLTGCARDASPRFSSLFIYWRHARIPYSAHSAAKYTCMKRKQRDRHRVERCIRIACAALHVCARSVGWLTDELNEQHFARFVTMVVRRIIPMECSPAYFRPKQTKRWANTVSEESTSHTTEMSHVYVAYAVPNHIFYSLRFYTGQT